MQLTQFTDYSLRTLVYLGAHPQRLCRISEIAAGYGISANHLMKVVNRLASCGYIESVRGRGGGLRLARAPHLINVGQVVRDMEERFDIVECFSAARQDCPLLPSCTLKSMLGKASRNFLATLDQYTLAEALGKNLADVFAGRKPARARRASAA